MDNLSITTAFRLLLQSLAAVLLLAPLHAAAAPLHVAAAADLATCIAELNQHFSAANDGVEVKSSVGSSGSFFAQIKNGAPFEVFLSADLFYPRELAKAGLADAATLVIYARGQLVMWSSDPGLDLNAGLPLLLDPSVNRIAVANPAVAPYGRAAKAALERAALWDAVRPKLVFGENVAQTAQFVETGNAQIGFVGSAQLNGPNGSRKGRSWLVPQELYPVLDQGGIVTAKGRANPAAAKYLAYLQSDDGRTVLQKCGFSVPDRMNQPNR
jgi:molybdate transport system substrate-binding protein